MRLLLLTFLLILTSSGMVQAQTGADEPTPEVTAEPPLRLLFVRNGAVYAFDVADQKTRPLTKEGGNLIGATVSPDGRYLAYFTSAGSLRWLNVSNDETTLFHNESVPIPENASNPRRYNPQPQALGWSADGKLLVSQALPDQRARLGIAELISPFWESFPPRPALAEASNLPADRSDYGCGTYAWSPRGSQLAWASGGPSGSECRFVSGLTIVDFETGSSSRIVAQEISPDANNPALKIIAGTDDPSWSADGEQIAFIMRTGIERSDDGTAYIVSSLYAVRADGSDLLLLDEEDRNGWAACPLWIGDQVYYVRGTYTDNPANSYGELYKIDPSTLDRRFVSSDVTCISNLSPDGHYAVIRRGDLSLRVWDVARESDIFVTDTNGGSDVMVAGWLPSE